MPTHWLLGLRAYEQIAKEHPEPSIDRDSFLFGCQGPDVLFFHRIQPWRFGKDFQHYGHSIHDDRPSPVFDSLRTTIAECTPAERPYMLGYALGMCCHYSYDTVAHPFVNWLVKRLSAKDARGPGYNYHCMIETMLDVIMLRHDLGIEPHELDPRECLSDKPELRRAVAVIYRRMLPELYGVELPERSAMQLTGDMRAAFITLRDRRYRKQALFIRAEHLAGHKNGMLSAHIMPRREPNDYDYANLAHTLWYNPYSTGRTDRADFFELTERALERTVQFVRFFLSALTDGSSFSEYTGELTFSYGVPPLSGQ